MRRLRGRILNWLGRKNINLDILWVYRRGADYYLYSPVMLRDWAITHRVSFELDKQKDALI